jgi:acyl-CoA thioesterase-2
VTYGDQSLLSLLTLQQIAPDWFATTMHVDDDHNIYGGQLLGQALVAAAATVEDDRAVHAMHVTFLRGGTPRRRLEYAVERSVDSQARSVRRVTVQQDTRVLLEVSVSFRRPMAGLAEQGHLPAAAGDPDAAVPRRPPSTLLDIDLRAADPILRPPALPARFWSRWTASDAPVSANLHAAVIAYVSDAFTGLFALAGLDDEQSYSMDWTSLDHSIRFHRPARADQWLLVELIGDVLADGRGTYQGRFFTAAGELVATLSQESVFRPLRRV